MKPAAIIVWTLLLVGCHAPATVVTPQGQAAYTADQIAVRVNELERAAIAANAQTPPGLDTSTTRQIVTFCVNADQTLRTAPQGWQVTLKTGWQALKAHLPPITNPAIAGAINTLDLVLAALGSQP